MRFWETVDYLQIRNDKFAWFKNYHAKCVSDGFIVTDSCYEHAPDDFWFESEFHRQELRDIEAVLLKEHLDAGGRISDLAHNSRQHELATGHEIYIDQETKVILSEEDLEAGNYWFTEHAGTLAFDIQYKIDEEMGIK